MHDWQLIASHSELIIDIDDLYSPTSARTMKQTKQNNIGFKKLKKIT